IGYTSRSFKYMQPDLQSPRWRFSLRDLGHRARALSLLPQGQPYDAGHRSGGLLPYVLLPLTDGAAADPGIRQIADSLPGTRHRSGGLVHLPDAAGLLGQSAGVGEAPRR